MGYGLGTYRDINKLLIRSFGMSTMPSLFDVPITVLLDWLLANQEIGEDDKLRKFNAKN